MKKLCTAFLFTVALSPPALAQGAPGNAAFCQSYAANAAGMGNLAIRKNPACLDYSKGVHGDFKMHYDWCMRTPASSVRGAEANIRRLVSACTGNAAPAQPTAPAGNGIVSLYTRSNGNLCLGAVAGMLNVGVLTNCVKRPARIRLDAAAKRIRVGDEPNLCLSFAVGKFSEINDLLVAPCNRVTVDLFYDRATTQIRSRNNFCVGVDGPVKEMSRLKMQTCSPTATGQKWVLDNAVARP